MSIARKFKRQVARSQPKPEAEVEGAEGEATLNEDGTPVKPATPAPGTFANRPSVKPMMPTPVARQQMRRSGTRGK